MTPEQLRVLLDQHAKWLRGDGGQCADLSDASLRGVDLSYAKRGDFVLTDGVVRTIGCGPYWAWTFPTTAGRVLEVGCKAYRLDGWPDMVGPACAAETDDPDKQAAYARELRALLAYCAALDGAEVRA